MRRTRLGGILPSRKSQLHMDDTMHIEMTAHSMITYIIARRLRRHDRYVWRPAFVESNAAMAIEAPKKNAATSKPPLLVGSSS